MKKLLFLLAFIPALLSGQTPTPLVDLSEYHDDDRLMEMIDNNFTNTTTGVYTQPIIKSDSINAGAMYYTDTYWDDMRVPLSNTKLTPSKSEPALEEFVTGVYAYGFDTGNDSTESLHFIAQIPHSWKVGTDLDVHLHWSPSTTNGGNVRWKLIYTAISINGTFGAVSNLWVTDAGDGTASKHQLVDLGDIDGSSLGVSSVIVGNITRLGDHTADDFTGVAFGLELDFHYQIDQPGSSNELTK